MYNIIYSHTVIPKYGKNILSQVFYFTESTATNKKSKKTKMHMLHSYHIWNI